MEERELNPRDIVKHVVRTAIAASKDRGISIQSDIGDDVPSVVLLQLLALVMNHVGLEVYSLICSL